MIILIGIHLVSNFSLLLLRAAKMAPVSAPLVIEFQGSSFPLRRTKPQSIVEKRPPHTAKLPEKHQRQARMNKHWRSSLGWIIIKQINTLGCLTSNLRSSYPDRIGATSQSVSQTLEDHKITRCAFAYYKAHIFEFCRVLNVLLVHFESLWPTGRVLLQEHPSWTHLHSHPLSSRDCAPQNTT